jgi:hypothetical protein
LVAAAITGPAPPSAETPASNPAAFIARRRLSSVPWRDDFELLCMVSSHPDSKAILAPCALLLDFTPGTRSRAFDSAPAQSGVILPAALGWLRMKDFFTELKRRHVFRVGDDDFECE